MKAIVLTFDEQLGLAELIHKRYKEMWPKCPITFRIPYNSESPQSLHYFRQQENVELIKVPVAMRATMKRLLQDIPDNEWVFWCIDDRFPLEIENVSALQSIYDYLRSASHDSRIRAVKLLKWTETVSDELVTIAESTFNAQKCRSLYGFYHHHFIRAGILKWVFNYDWKLLSKLTRRFDSKANLNTFTEIANIHHRNEFDSTGMLVPTKNILTLGEPVVWRKITQTAYDLLKEYECVIPDYPVIDGKIEYTDPSISKLTYLNQDQLMPASEGQQ